MKFKQVIINLNLPTFYKYACMTRNVKADNSRKYPLHGCIYKTYYLKLKIFKIYILENTDMNMCSKSLTSKMNIDKIKGDRSKVFRNNRKALNVPVKRYTVYIGLIRI